MRSGTILAVFAVAAAAVAVAVSCASCGAKPLAKAYERYEMQVDPLLQKEVPVMTRFVELYNEQLREANADRDRFVGFVKTQNVPFYDDLAAKAHAIEPGDPGLADAHAALLRYVDARRDAAHFVEDSLGAMQPGASEEALGRKSDAANEAVQAYQEKLDPVAPVHDPRFTELNNLSQQFVASMRDFTEGRASMDDLRAAIRDRILPRVKELRAGRFEEDASSKALLQAIATSNEFYDSILENLPRIDQTSRLQAEIRKRTTEGDELRKKFESEMSSVRLRL